MQVVRQLLTPARYLRIRGQTSDKLWVDWFFPALSAVVVTVGWVYWPKVVPLSGKAGLVESIGALMQVLVGFYVAALAAVATFQGSSLDEYVLNMTLGGRQLKRRQLLSYLFGYLALLSLVLYVIMLFKTLPAALVAAVPARVAFVARVAIALVHQFVFWQMIYITLFGLYYLTDRIHRSNNE